MFYPLRNFLFFIQEFQKTISKKPFRFATNSFFQSDDSSQTALRWKQFGRNVEYFSEPYD